MIREKQSLGNFGDYQSIGKEIYELRIHFGLGYRVYFAKKREFFVILLIGGDKSSQSKDITQSNYLAGN